MRRVLPFLLALAAAAPAQSGSEGPAAGEVEALAAEVVAREKAALRLAAEVRGAAAAEETLSAAMEDRRPETARLLAALEAVSRAVAAAPGPHPDGPIAAARAARLLGWLRPGLEAEAQRLAGALRELDAAQAREDAGLDALDAGLAALAAGRASLQAALEARDARPAGDGAGDGEIELIGMGARDAPSWLAAREADSLSALVARVAALTGAPAAASDRPLPMGWPVVGELRAGFGTADSAGVRRPGLLVSSPPQSLVVAPADGVVRYAGPFLEYGYVVVLEPRADVLVLLAGLATLDTEVGARVRAGAPLGFLGGRSAGAQEYLMLADGGNGETAAETLYIELRHGRGPVDPEPFFAGGNG